MPAPAPLIQSRPATIARQSPQPTARPAPPAPRSAPLPAITQSSDDRPQHALKVSSPDDASEKEARSTAQKIMRMPAPASATSDDKNTIRRRGVSDDHSIS